MASRPKRSFSREFKLQVVRQLVTGEKRLAQVCREYDLCETLARRWRAAGGSSMPRTGSTLGWTSSPPT